MNLAAREKAMLTIPETRKLAAFPALLTQFPDRRQYQEKTHIGRRRTDRMKTDFFCANQ